MSSKRFVSGDILGGVVSAIIALPLTLACGLLLFKSIPALQSFGINAAIYSAIIASFISAFIGSHSLQISGPRVATTLILADFLLTLFLDNPFSSSTETLSFILSMMIVCVIVSGLFQLLFAYLKLGTLIKFLPTSVTIGVSATIGILIVAKQFVLIFESSGEGVFNSISLNLIIIVIVVVVILFFKPFLQGILKRMMMLLPLIAPIVGMVLFYLLFQEDRSEFLVTSLEIGLPDILNYWTFMMSHSNVMLNYSAELLLASISIALIGSLSSLVSVNLLEEKQASGLNNPSLELKGQGIGNILAGIILGMPSAGSEARGVSNYNAGGRTRSSAIIHSLSLLLIIFGLGHYLTFVPEVVLYALLIHTGLVMTLPLFRLGLNICLSCLRNPNESIQDCIKDIIQTFVVVTVMLFTAYWVSLSASIVAGFATASMLFIYEMMKNTHYNVIECDHYHSKKVRTQDAMDILKKHGKGIKIIELEGAIFFGTADRLREMVEQLRQATDYIILDFRRVTEVDITGAQVIKNATKNNQNISFSLSHIRLGDDTYQALCSVGLIGQNGLSWFDNSDTALEQIEQRLLTQFLPQEEEVDTFTLSEMSILQTLTAVQLEMIEPLMKIKTFTQAEVLYQEGNQADELYFLKKGEVSIWVSQLNQEERVDVSLPKIRRITLTQGSILGEMAFFDDEVYHVDAIANTEVEVYVLSKESFEKLLENDPKLAHKFMLSICQYLSKRLRETTKEVQFLERWR